MELHVCYFSFAELRLVSLTFGSKVFVFNSQTCTFQSDNGVKISIFG